MSSNRDSEGVPIDHDGHRLEDVIPDVAPFAISGDVFRELMAGKIGDLKESHLEADPTVVHASSSGGIQIQGLEEVLVEDYDSSDEIISPKSDTGECRNTTSDTVHAILRTTKHERDALFNSRKRLSEVLSFLRSKGFSEEDVLASSNKEGFGPKVLDRDENGLPVLNSNVNVGNNPFKDKMKGQVVEEATRDNAGKMFEEMPKGKTDDATEVVKNAAAKKPSWSSVVQNNKPHEELIFDYHPMPAGISVVTPPPDVLKKGVEKFKFCLVGTFSKGTLPYSKMMDYARQAWESKGLCNVSQKDSHNFLFKFRSESEKNAVLARGTWYFERKPLLVRDWSSDLGTEMNSSIPLWVKFKNLPDYYWTREGLSCVASSIGPPIGADKITAQLNPVQFAKMCVRYKVGDPLPEKIKVAVLDGSSQKPSSTEFAEIEVSYPQRPMVCTGCKQLGHLIGACPLVKRVWVQKEAKTATEPAKTTNSEPVKTAISEHLQAEMCPAVQGGETAVQVSPSVGKAEASAAPREDGGNSDPKDIENAEEWTTVASKKACSPKNAEVSSGPSCSEKLPIFAALSKSMSKGQLKRVRRAGGRNSPKNK